eukprot:14374542-Alexandrium_andersonii.AAC.1
MRCCPIGAGPPKPGRPRTRPFKGWASLVRSAPWRRLRGRLATLGQGCGPTQFIEEQRCQTK